MNKQLYKVKIENSYSGHKRETIMLSADEETAILGAGVTHDDIVKVDKISAMDLGLAR